MKHQYGQRQSSDYVGRDFGDMERRIEAGARYVSEERELHDRRSLTSYFRLDPPVLEHRHPYLDEGCIGRNARGSLHRAPALCEGEETP